MRGYRQDSNHSEIRDAFRERGFSVRDTHMVGDGFPDIVVGRYGLNYLVEIKDGEKSPSKRKLTPDEHKFQDNWLGQYCVVESIDDVMYVCHEMEDAGSELDSVFNYL
jgi:hypothetical protein